MPNSTLNPRVRFCSWILARKRFIAATYPPFGIFIRKEWWEAQTEERQQKLMLHELCHWSQYQRYGLFGFYFRYVWNSIRFGYRGHPMEEECRQSSNF